ncbi:hypothetical protein XH87_10990 [Bradyrhizobium sp. CCBAU 53415]|nr:hypothetical protein [Bradyrhizobium sp. CCBAU 53415]
MLLIAFEDGRMQRDFFRGGWFTLQLLRYPLSFGIQGSRLRSENGWIAMSFRDRIHQSFDFPV